MWTSLGTNINQCRVTFTGRERAVHSQPCQRAVLPVQMLLHMNCKGQSKRGENHKLGYLEACTLPEMQNSYLGCFIWISGPQITLKKLQKLLLLQLKLPKASRHGCLVGGEKTHTAVVKFTIWKRSLSLQKTGSRPIPVTSEEILAEKGRWDWNKALTLIALSRN